jgi:hypothetical protein
MGNAEMGTEASMGWEDVLMEALWRNVFAADEIRECFQYPFVANSRQEAFKVGLRATPPGRRPESPCRPLVQNQISLGHRPRKFFRSIKLGDPNAGQTWTEEIAKRLNCNRHCARSEGRRILIFGG